VARSGLLGLYCMRRATGEFYFARAFVPTVVLGCTVLTSLGAATEILLEATKVSGGPAMAHANVSNGVLTIISSFSNGLDVLKKLRRAGKKGMHRSKPTKRNDEDALRLSRSLRHGPEEIGREYQVASMRCDSEQYATGDGRADPCSYLYDRHN
jgi:hypothetical protein